MRFFPVFTAAVLSLYSTVLADSCEKGPFITARVGKPISQNRASDIFCEAEWEKGEVITGMRVWWLKFQVKAVQFRYAQGNWGDRVLGKNDESGDDQYAEGTWDENDEIGMELWNNKPDDGDAMDAVGKILITKGEREILKAGGSKIAKDSIKVNAGSGRLLAVRGAAGGHVSSLEFQFLESTVKKIEMKSIKYTPPFKTWESDKKNIEVDRAESTAWWKNSDKTSGKQYLIESSPARTTSKSLTNEESHTFGFNMGMSITAGAKLDFPLFGAEFSATFETGITDTKGTSKSETTSDSKTITLKFQESGPLKPQSCKKCELLIESGTYNADYEAEMQVELANGQTYTYKNKGTYTSVGYGRSFIECKDLALKECPNVAKEGVSGFGGSRLARFVHES